MHNYQTDDWPSAPPLSVLINRAHCIDAFELLDLLPDNSVDMILTDPPYGVLYRGLGWDIVTDWSRLWAAVRRVLKPQSACIVTSVQPFTSYLVNSNLDWFRQELIWEKESATGFLNAKLRHMRIHENILVFSSGCTTGGANNGVPMRYYPQMRKAEPYGRMSRKGIYKGYGKSERVSSAGSDLRYPTTIVKFGQPNKYSQTGVSTHPTEKPVALMEYLIQTYSTPGDIVLDFFAGSGSTAVAARNLGRQFIIGEQSLEYVEIARRRLAQPYTPPLAGMAAG